MLHPITCGRDDLSAEGFAPITTAAPRARRRRLAGFTLIETMVALAAAGIVSSVAYPSFQDQLQKSRRADAVVTAMKLQLAQERHRSNHAAYASLADLGVAARTPSGHYLLAIEDTSADGYTLRATASGPQARDTACRHLKLVVDGTQATHTSGADANVGNNAAANRRCWGL